MASHDSTPRSVLEAPEQTYINVYSSFGLNRERRRHYRMPTPEGSIELGRMMRHKPMISAHMEPAKKVDGSDEKRPRRGKKGRKYGK